MWRLRAQLGSPKDELAFASGLHRNYVGSVERGKCSVSLDNVERIAAPQDVGVSVLLRQPLGEHDSAGRSKTMKCMLNLRPQSA
jgi:transcriptional regulator with XRE-family HTH domain